MQFGLKKFLCLFFLLAGLDQLVKYFAFSYLPKEGFALPQYPWGGIAVFKNFFGIDFSLSHVENDGMAWGILSAYGKIIFWLRLVVVAVLLSYLFLFNKEKRLGLPLTLIAIGALCNICDAFIYGHVIDIFHFVFWGYSFPVFNLADCYITFGVIILLFVSLKQKKAVHR